MESSVLPGSSDPSVTRYAVAGVTEGGRLNRKALQRTHHTGMCRTLLQERASLSAGAIWPRNNEPATCSLSSHQLPMIKSHSCPLKYVFAPVSRTSAAA